MSQPEMTDSECEELRLMALAMPDEHQAVSPRELARQLQFIEATLPAKNVEEQAGQMRTAVYTRLLAGYSKEALSYMTERVCRELDWFPTPHQCLDILAKYQPPLTRKDRALHLCAQHTQAKFDEWLSALRSGEPVELVGKPDRWLRIAAERGYLRWVDDRYQQRIPAP